MRENKVFQSVAALPGHGLDDLVLLAYDDTPVKAHGIARRSLLAHLEKLLDEGRIATAGAGWQVAEAG